MENIYTVLLTAVTVLGSAGAWRFYEKRALHKERDEDFIRHDCKDRISKLEALLESSSREKDELRKMIIDLTAKVATLQTTVEFLRKEEEKTKITRTKKV
jgi:predicted RNase H-like nuclease (RuvC/YqgF family)